MEELYGILEKAHKETGHGGRDRMITHLNNGYANISRESIELFTSLCENCNMKKSTHIKMWSLNLSYQNNSMVGTSLLNGFPVKL